MLPWEALKMENKIKFVEKPTKIENKPKKYPAIF